MNTLFSRDSLMNIVSQFRYALISGPSTGWTTGGTRTGWGQGRQILFEGTERERQGQKNKQQKDDRSPAAAAAPDEAKKGFTDGKQSCRMCRSNQVYRSKNPLRAKLFHNRYDRKYLLAVPTKARILCLDSSQSIAA